MQKIIAICIQDLLFLTKKYSELHKVIQMAINENQSGLYPKYVNVLFNLNNEIDLSAVSQFLNAIMINIEKV